jgi:NAD(P)-dependent dehydrogenase (short-subunit alcohol dehydrogenase family)
MGLTELTGKVAFITGAAGGIGLGMATACTDAGMKVALADIDAAELERSTEALRRRDADVIAVPLDVTDMGAWDGARRRVVAELGVVQLLCNNAGVSVMGIPIYDLSPEIWRKVNAINYDAIYYGVRAFLDGMVALGSGHIVNTSSNTAVIGSYPKLTAYMGSKAAVIGFTETIRADLAPRGVGVSVLIPGEVRSRLWRTSRGVRGLPDIDTPPEDISGQSARAPGDPVKVGRMVLDAVLRNDAYIFTDAAQHDLIEQRFNEILAASRRAGEGPATILPPL